LAALAFVALLAASGGRAPAAAVEPTVPATQGFVSDNVGVVDATSRQALNALIGELQAKTGAEIAIVVVRSTQPLSAFDYAMKIAEDWKPGEAGKDNGIVFLVAVDDREMFILTGYGVEGPLPDGRVGAIRDRLITPAFRGGDYAGGIMAATAEMAARIATDAGVELTGKLPVRRAPEQQLSPLAMAVLFAMFLAVLFVIVRNPVLAMMLLGGGSSRRRGGFGHGGFGRGGFGGLGGGGGGGFGGFGGGGFGGGGAGGRW